MAAMYVCFLIFFFLWMSSLPYIFSRMVIAFNFHNTRTEEFRRICELFPMFVWDELKPKADK
jgi:hypothetical protein